MLHTGVRKPLISAGSRVPYYLRGDVEVMVYMYNNMCYTHPTPARFLGRRELERWFWLGYTPKGICKDTVIFSGIFLCGPESQGLAILAIQTHYPK
jgi:hypothetical protein